MTTYRRRLPGGYGVLTVTESVDTDRAAVTYAVRAPRVSGTFVALPDWTTCKSRQALPDGLHLHLGTGPEFTRAEDRQNRPKVNGITLTGTCHFEPLEWLSRPEPMYRFNRSIGAWRTASVPDATNRLALAVVTQILILWISRPDRAELIRTRARARARARLSELRHGPIRSAEAEIARLQAELAEHLAFAAELEPLANEHQALTATREEQHPS